MTASRWRRCARALPLLAAMIAAGCGGGGSPVAPAFGGGRPSGSSGATAAPTPAVYTGTQVALGDRDNGRTVGARVGSSLLIVISVPLADDCVAPHMCAVWQLDDGADVLGRSQDLTTCDRDTCVARREDFLGHGGNARLSLVTMQPCPYWATARCLPQPGPTLWSVVVSVAG